MAQMANVSATDYADCIGVHYTAGTVSPAQSSGASAGSHYSWYYGPIREQYFNAFGGSRKLCFTDFGYLTADGLGSLPPAFSWAGSNSVASQAQWLAQAALASQASGKVRLMIVWNIDINSWNAATADTRAGYAIIRPNGSCPACDSLRTVMTARN